MRYSLDHNAGSPVEPRVLDRFLEVERECPGNPGSLHAAGRRARAALESARHELAAALGVADDEIVFVASGTEANNLAVRGLGDVRQPVQLAAVEHPSVLEPAAVRGARWWTVEPGGRVVVTPVPAAVGLVCMVHAQNETGVVQPIAAARAAADAAGVPLHVDASQSLGRIDPAPVFAAADSVAISGHKLGGLRGGSALVVRRSARLEPLLLGGKQEHGRRAGTPSPALAAATARAVRIATAEWPARAAAMQAAAVAFLDALGTVGGWRRLGDDPRLPNTVMVCFDGVDGRTLLPALDMAGVEASLGSACSAGSPEPPRVLEAMGLDADTARRCVRFSFSWTTPAEIARRAGEAVAATFVRLAELGSSRRNR